MKPNRTHLVATLLAGAPLMAAGVATAAAALPMHPVQAEKQAVTTHTVYTIESKGGA